MRSMTYYRSRRFASYVMTCWSQPRRSGCLPTLPVRRQARLLLQGHSCQANCASLPWRLVRSWQSVRKYLINATLLLLSLCRYATSA
jgi:hypothetical protein